MTSSKTIQSSLLIRILLYFSLLSLVFPSISVSSFAPTSTISSSSSSISTNKNNSKSMSQDSTNDNDINNRPVSPIGKLEELKSKEAKLSKLLESIRKEKLSVLRSRPLRIGIIGFGRFGQFMAKTFVKYGDVVVTSRSDYTEIANGMGVKYVPMSDMAGFLEENLDVIMVSVSITSFEPTIAQLSPHLHAYLKESSVIGPLIVDVLSVKEHPRQVMLDLLPPQCDILCTHPMFGPDSGKNSWRGLTFVYERTRIDGVILNPHNDAPIHQLTETERDENSNFDETFADIQGTIHHIHESNEAHIVGMDRLERFLSIWEEEGCSMISMSCQEHDQYSANSQFITHLMGRILSTQGLKPTPIDTQGFKSVLNLVGNTMADSFELFYGLYKYNANSLDIIQKLKLSMEDVVNRLTQMDEEKK